MGYPWFTAIWWDLMEMNFIFINRMKVGVAHSLLVKVE